MRKKKFKLKMIKNGRFFSKTKSALKRPVSYKRPV